MVSPAAVEAEQVHGGGAKHDGQVEGGVAGVPAGADPLLEGVTPAGEAEVVGARAHEVGGVRRLDVGGADQVDEGAAEGGRLAESEPVALVHRQHQLGVGAGDRVAVARDHGHGGEQLDGSAVVPAGEVAAAEDRPGAVMGVRSCVEPLHGWIRSHSGGGCV